jgi:hypothetical protein
MTPFGLSGSCQDIFIDVDVMSSTRTFFGFEGTINTVSKENKKKRGGEQ